MAYKMKRPKSYSANEIFRKRFKGSKNFITPNIIKKGKLNKNVAYELSSGRGFESDMLYGVTLVSINSKGETRSLFEENKAFNSKAEAEGYINKLKKKFN